MKYRLWIYPATEKSQEVESAQWVSVIYDDGAPHPEIVSIDLQKVLEDYQKERADYGKTT